MSEETKVDIEEMRKICGMYDEEMGCMDDEPESCPYHSECEEADLVDDLIEEEEEEGEGDDK